MSRNFVKTACALALMFACAAPALAAVKLDALIPIGPQITKASLPNGLTYYIQKNARPEKRVELRLVVRAGSAQEDEDQRGLAHFTEHMAFNGSTHFKKHELVSYLQSIGVQFGADLNAYTSFDETVYILPIPTEKKENLATGFQVLEDWAHGLAFNDADVDAERGIILEEMRIGKGVGDRIFRQVFPKQVNGSLYAERLPIGKEDVLKNFKYEAIKRFYKDWYRPDLMAVVVVGDIEPAEAEKLIHQHFDGLKAPATVRAREDVAVPARAKSEGLTVTDKEAPASVVQVLFSTNVLPPERTYGAYRAGMVTKLFNAMLGQRLAALSQQASPPFVAGFAGESKLVGRYQGFSAGAVVGREGAAPALNALIAENEKARQFGFAPGELEQAKKNLMRSIDNAFNEREKTASSTLAEEYIRNFLDGEAISGVEAEHALVSELLPGISLADVNAHAKHVIPHAGAKFVAYTGSDKSEVAIPSAAQLVAIAEAAEKTSVTAHVEKAVAMHLMDAAPIGGKIVSDSTDASLGTTTLVFANGVKAVLKPTDFKNDQILMSAVRFGGTSLLDDKDLMAARYAGAIVGSMGLKDWSPLDLQKVLAGRSAAIQVGSNETNDIVAGGATSDDLETMLQLTYLKFMGARKDESLFKSFIGKQQDLSRTALARPEAVFSDTVSDVLFQQHPRIARTPRPEDFAKLTLNQSVDLYQQRFSSAKDFSFFIVGSFDVAKVKPMLAAYLGGLPTADLPTMYRDVGIRPVTGVVKKEVRMGAEAKSTISLTFTGPADFSEDEGLRMQAMLDIVNLKIIDVVREKLSLIYGGGASGGISKQPYEHYTIQFNLPCAPENVDKVIAATFAEIEKIKAQGPEEADLNKVKTSRRQGWERSIKENGYWLGRLQSAMLNGTNPAALLEGGKRIAALSGADMQAAAKRYFNMGNYVQVVLYPDAPAK